MSVSHGWRLLKRQSGLVCDRPHVARLTSQHGGLQWPLWEGPGALFSPALPVTVTKGYIGPYHLPGGLGWSQPAPSKGQHTHKQPFWQCPGAGITMSFYTQNNELAGEGPLQTTQLAGA